MQKLVARTTIFVLLASMMTGMLMVRPAQARTNTDRIVVGAAVIGGIVYLLSRRKKNRTTQTTSTPQRLQSGWGAQSSGSTGIGATYGAVHGVTP